MIDNKELVDEIIDSAADLPVESQFLLLMVAKGMLFSRKCLKSQVKNKSEVDLPHNL